VIVSFEGNEDAGVFKINDNLAIVQTVDFITPVVDNPYIYGQIAAANSLSDVFAMGGEVKTALNLIGFDSVHHSKEVLTEILQGGESKVTECNGVILGGHTIETIEMLYGLSVTGFVHPSRVLRNNSVREGDILIITKPIGVGILSTGVKADLVDDKVINEMVKYMSMLNYKASVVANQFDISACTDVTGFGLAAHSYEMTHHKFTIEIEFDKIPILKEALYQASMGIIPGGAYSNQNFMKDKISIKKKLTFEEEILLFDPQTSGGLLLTVNEKDANKFITQLIDEGVESAVAIGYVKKFDENFIKIV